MLRTDRTKTGWWALCLLLCLTLSSSAWALDFESSIERQESSNSQILQGLGRDKGIGAGTSAETRKTVHLQLIRKTKRHNRHVVR